MNATQFQINDKFNITNNGYPPNEVFTVVGVSDEKIDVISDSPRFKGYAPMSLFNYSLALHEIRLIERSTPMTNAEQAWHEASTEWEKVGLKPGQFTAFKTGYAAAEARFRSALEEIAQCEGVFNRDPLKHADNVISNMRNAAMAALGAATEKFYLCHVDNGGCGCVAQTEEAHCPYCGNALTKDDEIDVEAETA